jgi:dTDP-4-amino-4,6-dideoxygalactose transaminase
VKLRRLATWNAQRREIAARYNELLASWGEALTIPYEPFWAKANYHLYVIKVRNRDEFRDYMSEAHISTGIHYPIPLHLQKAYESLGYAQGSFPVTEKTASEVVSLPMYPQLGLEDQKLVAAKTGEFVESTAAPAAALRSMSVR